MKAILYVTVLFGMYSCGSAISGAVDENALTDVSVIEVAGKSKDQLFVETNTWMAHTFNQAKSVIDYSDKEAGRIVGKYVFDFMEGIYSYSGKTTVRIDIKDEKVRIEFSDPLFLYKGSMGSGVNSSWQPVRNKIIGSYHEQWEIMKESLKSDLRTDEVDW